MGITRQYSSKNEIDIVVHVAEDMDDQNRQRVEYAMMKATGIVRAYFDRFRCHLLIIGYNPSQTDWSSILNLVRQQDLNGQLIGVITECGA